MPKIEASLAAISAQKEGRPGWRRAGRDFARIFRKSRTNHWELTAPSFWGIIEAKDGLFPGSFPGRYRGGRNVPKIEASLASIRVGKRVARIGGGLATISPGLSGNCGPIDANYRCLFLENDRGKGWPIFGAISIPISGRLNMRQNRGILSRD